MASFLFRVPQIVDANGDPYSGAKCEIFLTGSDTQSPGYSDTGLTTPLTNPVVADSKGLFAPIFLDQAITYKVVISDSSDNVIQSIDPVKAEAGTANVALGGLTPAADKVPYFTGASSAALADFPAYGRSIAATASEAAFKTLVNLEIGVDVESYTAPISAATWIAGTSTAKAKITPAELAAAITALSATTGYVFAYEYTGSGTFTPSADANVVIIATGAGGSGAAVRSGSNATATGGAAGATVIKLEQLTTSQTLTITPGTGGVAVSTTGGSVPGNDGTATTVTDGASISITAAGGEGGNAGASPQSGGAGGTASGGDFNFDGGAGGAGNGTYGATGGGAVGLTADGNAAGQLTSAGATGGAGVGASSATNSTSGGAAPTLLGTILGINVAVASGGAGASGTGAQTGTAGGRLSGGGGATNTTTGTANGGAGGLGAGGGGAFVYTSGTATSGAGGNGFVIILSTKPKA